MQTLQVCVCTCPLLSKGGVRSPKENIEKLVKGDSSVIPRHCFVQLQFWMQTLRYCSRESCVLLVSRKLVENLISSDACCCKYGALHHSV